MGASTFEGFTEIGQINIPVHDLDQAVEFYQDTLGIEYLFQVPGMAFFNCGGIRLMLAIPKDELFDHPSSIIYFKVEDIHSTTEALRARGVEIISNPELIAEMSDHDLWMSFFKDPDGNTLAIIAEQMLSDRPKQSG